MFLSANECLENKAGIHLHLTGNDILGKRFEFLELVVPDLQLVELSMISMSYQQDTVECTKRIPLCFG